MQSIEVRLGAEYANAVDWTAESAFAPRLWGNVRNVLACFTRIATGPSRLNLLKSGSVIVSCLFSIVRPSKL